MTKPDRNFLVYEHIRPSGEVFYVGKGNRRRAFDFSPSRRTEWHRNIVSKYGRENICVRIYPCATEEDAFDRERELIAQARLMGHVLANLTDGGEGVSGRAMSERQKQALEKGRVKGKRGRPGRRPELDAWRQSPAGREHIARLASEAAVRLHAERQAVCCECGEQFTTRSAKARACSRLCEQRNRRAKERAHAG